MKMNKSSFTAGFAALGGLAMIVGLAVTRVGALQAPACAFYLFIRAHRT